MASTGDTWRLGRRPALDGLRGVAVLLVVFAHCWELLPVRRTAAGGAGVSIFFVLSGFLISSLLLEERRASGRVDLVGFFRRRAVQLLPALVVMLAATVTMGIASPAVAAAALLYVANFYQAATGHIGGLGHTWSLSVEEQFYLLWPMVVLAVGRNRLRLLLVGTMIGALLAFAARVALYDGTAMSAFQVQRWTYTAADPLLIGCALALLMHGRRPRAVSRYAAPLAGVLVVVALSADGLPLVLQPTVVALAAAATIYAYCRGVDEASSWLTVRPLVWVGQRSYGLYLWHIPTLIYAGMLGVTGLSRVAVGVALAVGVTVLSWRLVEQPCSRMFRRSRAAGAANLTPSVPAHS